MLAIAIILFAIFAKSETVTKEYYIRTIALADIAYAQYTQRYFNASKKALKAGRTGPYSLQCENGTNQWNDSANPDNIVWEGDIPRFKNAEENLLTLKIEKSEQLKLALKAYIDSKYNGTEQAGLLALVSYGNTNQKSVCKDIFDWMFDIVQKTDFINRLQAVQTAADKPALDAISIDFSNNDTTKPPFNYLDVLTME